MIAHTSPFFEILPELRDEFICVAWEHGDPTPPFSIMTELSANVKNVKHKHIYPNVDAVVAIAFCRSRYRLAGSDRHHQWH